MTTNQDISILSQFGIDVPDLARLCLLDLADLARLGQFGLDRPDTIFQNVRKF